jgi:hypothetical protein
VVLKALNKRQWLRTGHMLRKAHDFIDQLPAVKPMQNPSAEVFWLDIMTRPRP